MQVEVERKIIDVPGALRIGGPAKAREELPSDENDDVVGWGSCGAPWAQANAPSVGRAIGLALYDMGVREAFGILGGGIAPFSAGLSHTPIRFYHFRHEAGAGFAALEAHCATGRPTVVVATTGPGIMNVLNAIMAAKVDGGKVLLVSGFTSTDKLGRGAIQETSSATMPVDVTRPGSLFHEVAVPETEAELANAMARIARGFERSGSFIAHLGLPMNLQTQLVSKRIQIRKGRWTVEAPRPSTEAIDACLEALSDPSAILWVGHGASGASATLSEFAIKAQLPVVCSPRAKGVFPEDHPLFVGVSGAGGTPLVRMHFEHNRPRKAVVVGTQLSEVTTFLAPSLVPEEGWIHVDTNPEVFGAAYPDVPGVGIVADAIHFFEALCARAEQTGWYTSRPSSAEFFTRTSQPLRPRARGSVRPAYLMQLVQRHVVEDSEALIMSESGSSFTWCNSRLRFNSPGRYRTSAAWGSMGHFTTGCVGASLAGQQQVVAVVGDGAMLMNNEVSTAVQYGAKVVWIVLNDSQLGLNQHGMVSLGMRPVETQLPRTDFEALARAQGAAGARVRSEDELEAALEAALAHEGPFVLDVFIDPSIPSPVLAERNDSLFRRKAKLGLVEDA